MGWSVRSRPLCPHSRRPPHGQEPTLTGLPALSQRLSGKGLPARATQGRDTGCLSRTRTVEALLAICGGAAGKGPAAGRRRFPGAAYGGRGSSLSPPQGTCPGSRGPSAPLGTPGHGHICPKGWGAMGGLPGVSPPPASPASPDPLANRVQSPRAGSPPGPSRKRFELHRHTGPGLQGPHLRGRREAGLTAGGHTAAPAPVGSGPQREGALGTAWPCRGGWEGAQGRGGPWKGERASACSSVEWG